MRVRFKRQPSLNKIERKTTETGNKIEYVTVLYSDLCCWKAVKALQDNSSESSQGFPIASARPETAINLTQIHLISKQIACVENN